MSNQPEDRALTLSVSDLERLVERASARGAEQVMDHHSSVAGLKKNGESVGAWVQRSFTVNRILVLLVITMTIIVGIWVRAIMVEQRSVAAEQKANAALEAAEALKKGLEPLGSEIRTVRFQISVVQQEINQIEARMAEISESTGRHRREAQDRLDVLTRQMAALQAIVRDAGAAGAGS